MNRSGVRSMESDPPPAAAGRQVVMSSPWQRRSKSKGRAVTIRHPTRSGLRTCISRASRTCRCASRGTYEIQRASRRIDYMAVMLELPERLLRCLPDHSRLAPPRAAMTVSLRKPPIAMRAGRHDVAISLCFCVIINPLARVAMALRPALNDF